MKTIFVLALVGLTSYAYKLEKIESEEEIVREERAASGDTQSSSSSSTSTSTSTSTTTTTTTAATTTAPAKCTDVVSQIPYFPDCFQPAEKQWSKKQNNNFKPTKNNVVNAAGSSSNDQEKYHQIVDSLNEWTSNQNQLQVTYDLKIGSWGTVKEFLECNGTVPVPAGYKPSRGNNGSNGGRGGSSGGRFGR